MRRSHRVEGRVIVILILILSGWGGTSPGASASHPARGPLRKSREVQSANLPRWNEARISGAS